MSNAVGTLRSIMGVSTDQPSTVYACGCNTGFSKWSEDECSRCGDPIREYVRRDEAAELGEAWSKSDRALSEALSRVMEMGAVLREIESVGAHTAENCKALADLARRTLKGEDLK